MFGVDPNSVGGTYQQTRLPTIEDGEEWFEAVNWIIAAREARQSLFHGNARRMLWRAGSR